MRHLYEVVYILEEKELFVKISVQIIIGKKSVVHSAKSC